MSAFQSSLWAFPSVFPVQFLVILFLTQTGNVTWSSCGLKPLLLIVFTNELWTRIFPERSKQAWIGASQGAVSSSRAVLVEKSFGVAPDLLCLLQWQQCCYCGRLLWLQRRWFSGLSWSVERGAWEQSKLTWQRAFSSYWDLAICLSKRSLDGCKPLVNFQSSNKVDLDNILPVFLLLLGRSGFSEVFTPFQKCFSLVVLFRSNFQTSYDFICKILQYILRRRNVELRNNLHVHFPM